MAGYFSAIVRAPLTGIILIFEMTGSLSQMLSLAIVSIAAYITATLLHSTPIYESLLDRLLQRQGQKGNVSHGQKILAEFVVEEGSSMDGIRIAEVTLPKECLLVSVKRGTQEIIPRGRTRLQVGDVVVVLTREEEEPLIHDQMEMLCREKV